jgi:hypothetical protein
VEIRDRGKPVARIVRLDAASSETDEERLERLSAAGVVRRGRGSVAWLLEEAPVVAPGAELRAALDEERDER